MRLTVSEKKRGQTNKQTENRVLFNLGQGRLSSRFALTCGSIMQKRLYLTNYVRRDMQTSNTSQTSFFFFFFFFAYFNSFPNFIQFLQTSNSFLQTFKQFLQNGNIFLQCLQTVFTNSKMFLFLLTSNCFHKFATF